MLSDVGCLERKPSHATYTLRYSLLADGFEYIVSKYARADFPDGFR